MNSAKRYLVIALSFAICMTVFAAFAPRIAHAITATLVQVVNTYSNPAAVTRADDPGRNVVRLTLYSSIPSNPGFVINVPLNDSTGSPFTVPVGKRLVVDSISSFAYPPAGVNVDGYMFNNSVFNAGTFTPLLIKSVPGYGGTVWQNALLIRDYVDQGQQYLVSMFADVTPPSAIIFNVQVVGHLVDCTNGGGC
jgi:hypothetical protein